MAADFIGFVADSSCLEVIVGADILGAVAGTLQDVSLLRGRGGSIEAVEIEDDIAGISDYVVRLARLAKAVGGRERFPGLGAVRLFVREAVEMLSLLVLDTVQAEGHRVDGGLQIRQVLAHVLILHQGFVGAVEIRIELDQNIFRPECLAAVRDGLLCRGGLVLAA